MINGSFVQCNTWLTLNFKQFVEKRNPPSASEGCLWEHTGSNRGPSACKADALNQLSYAPFFVGSAKIGAVDY